MPEGLPDAASARLDPYVSLSMEVSKLIVLLTMSHYR